MDGTQHTLTVSGQAGTTAWYRFKLAYGGGFEATDDTESPDEIEQNGRVASGKVGMWNDTYKFHGVMTHATFDGDAEDLTITIDGTEYSHDELPEAFNQDTMAEGSGEDTTDTRVIGIRDIGGKEANDYRLVVEGGPLKNTTDFGATASDGEPTTNAEGSPKVLDAVYGGTDSWSFSGGVIRLTLNDKARVELNFGDGWKPADKYEFVSEFGGGQNTHGDEAADEHGDSAPVEVDTGGSTGANQNRPGLRGSPRVETPAYVAVPGDLVGAMDDIYEDANGGGLPEQRTFVQAEPNSTFDPGETAHIHRMMQLNAEGATFAPSGSYKMFTFDYGASIFRPFNDLRRVQDNDGWFDATVYHMDPKFITMNTDGRSGGVINRRAWQKRGGAHNAYRFLENTRSGNQFGNAAGVHGGWTLGHWDDESTLFRISQNSNEDGWQRSSNALVENLHSTRGVGYPVVIDSRGKRGYINSTVVRGYFAGPKVGYTITGSQIARKNQFRGSIQPQDGVTRNAILIDNPTAEYNLARAALWDGSKASGAMMRVKRSEHGGWRTANNVAVDLTGHDSGDYLNDTSEGDGNAVVSSGKVYR